jgi:hypothetical protein
MNKIIKLIEQNKNNLTRDQLHKISKYADEIIVNKFILKNNKVK